MKVYISGKITGDAGYREKFAAAEERLAKKGHIVLNPAILPAGLSRGEYMRICIAMMEAADAVFFIKDYMLSRGAMLEWAWCQYFRKKSIYETVWDTEGED